MLVLWLIPALATAQAPDCDAAFDVNRFLKGLDEAEEAIVVPDQKAAHDVLSALHENVRCLPDPLHPRHLVRYGRARALEAYLDRRDSEIPYWGQLALLDRTVAWPDRIGPTHPGRRVLTLMARRAEEREDGHGLAVPPSGGLIIDGRAAVLPEASPQAPHLMQIMDADGHIEETFWMDGVMWRQSLLTNDPTPVQPPMRYATPNPDLDPYAPVVLWAQEEERRAQTLQAAQTLEREREKQFTRALRLEEARAAKREELKQRLQRRQPLPTEDDTLAESPLDATISLEPLPALVNVYVNEEFPRRDTLELGRDTAVCDDLIALEPRSLLGKLSEEQFLCLQTRLATEERQTTRGKISRLIMADAWAKDDRHRWEGAIRRHLTEIDRSDPDLCFVFANWLASQGRASYREAIRYAALSLENAHVWEGEHRVSRVSGLHRIQSFAAMQLWLLAEERLVREPTAKVREQAAYWRHQTKNLAREWLQFSFAANIETDEAEELCISSAGTVDYCDVQ